MSILMERRYVAPLPATPPTTTIVVQTQICQRRHLAHGLKKKKKKSPGIIPKMIQGIAVHG